MRLPFVVFAAAVLGLGTGWPPASQGHDVRPGQASAGAQGGGSPETSPETSAPARP